MITKEKGTSVLGNTLYTSKKGTISMVEPCGATFYCFEIYSYEKLFTDVERYETLTEAEDRINELLESGV